MPKMQQSEVLYREAYSGEEERCANCHKFTLRRHRCAMVDGFIQPQYVCELWSRSWFPKTLEKVRQEIGREDKEEAP